MKSVRRSSGTWFMFDSRDLREWVLILLVLLLPVGLAITGRTMVSIELMAFAFLAYVACRFPLLTVLGFVVIGILPSMIQMTPIYNESFGLIGGGLYAIDAVLMAMGFATGWRIMSDRQIRLKSKGIIGVLISLLAMWLLFEILRNIRVYGLSAPGEFRFRYLILVMPLYVGLFFTSSEQRKKLFQLLILSSL
ncbi:MAG: hypothetical protein C0401_11080, partial [Anaerolinea sp.]|nr:hypothetical protein [Anaerolinea sp.]